MIYNLIIYLYVGAVKLAALFSKKVSVMVKGEKDAFTVLQQRIDRQAKYIWFHAASLGELLKKSGNVIRTIRFCRLSSLLRDTRCGRIIRGPMWYVTCLWIRRPMPVGLWNWPVRVWLSL